MAAQAGPQSAGAAWSTSGILLLKLYSRIQAFRPGVAGAKQLPGDPEAGRDLVILPLPGRQSKEKNVRRDRDRGGLGQGAHH